MYKDDSPLITGRNVHRIQITHGARVASRHQKNSLVRAASPKDGLSGHSIRAAFWRCVLTSAAKVSGAPRRKRNPAASCPITPACVLSQLSSTSFGACTWQVYCTWLAHCTCHRLTPAVAVISTGLDAGLSGKICAGSSPYQSCCACRFSLKKRVNNAAQSRSEIPS